MKAKQQETVVILDFGAQYSQLIARRVRELNVYCEILPCDTALQRLKEKDPRAIILSGGPSSVYGEERPSVAPGLFDFGVPILGICYGMQLMAHMLKGEVVRAKKREYGRSQIEPQQFSSLFRGFEQGQDKLTVWMSHGDQVQQLPTGFSVLAKTDNCQIAAMADEERKLYGVQFHPEVAHTDRGMDILKNFLFAVCRCSGDWTIESFVTNAIGKIRTQVGNGRAICGLSGGVDSSVAAALVHRAIGDQLTCIFVDHGLMRKGEPEEVVRTFKNQFQMNLVHVQAQKRFLSKLSGVSDPEQKRKIIGEEFIRVFEEEAEKLDDAQFLVQGTVYPDVIESGTHQAATIKSHHNVGGLPEDLRLQLVEPLRELFKDEVRRVGEELDLPQAMVWRHPFPGPGLAVRVIGEIQAHKVEILRELDAIILEEIRRAGLYRDIWQAFGVLTDTKTVGVMGDERTYDYAAAVRAVTSDDAMTADWAKIPYDVLETISLRIMNEVEGVNRVVYDISSKPPATIEWE